MSNRFKNMKVTELQLKHAQFHLTNKCNLDCLFCWCHYNKNKYKDVSSETLMNYLKEVCEMAPEVITLSGGGEPLCRQATLLKMIKFIKINYPKISGLLITNATLLNKPFVEELTAIGWDEIIISLQAPTPEINDFIMGRTGAFKKALEGIRLINEAKKVLNKEKPSLNIKTVITKHNHRYLLGMVQLAEKLDIKNVEFRMVNEGGKKNLTIDQSEFIEFRNLVKKAKDYAKNLNMNIKFEFDTAGLESKNNIYQQNKEKKICLIPFTELVVFGNGAVSVCCNYFNEQFKKISKAVIKNDKKSIKEIWLNEFQEMRENIQNQESYPICKTCSQDMLHHNKDIQP